MTVTEFLYYLNNYHSEYIHKYIQRLQVGMVDQQLLEKVKVILLEALIESIEYYYGSGSAIGSDNFCTEDEIETALDHCNRIMGTTLILPT